MSGTAAYDIKRSFLRSSSAEKSGTKQNGKDAIVLDRETSVDSIDGQIQAERRKQRRKNLVDSIFFRKVSYLFFVFLCFL